jgi:hypothetical protein
VTPTVDRTGWPPGPWDDEPEDRLAFQASGLDCLLLRSHIGTWCGYVGVPPEHPLYGKDYDDVHEEVDIRVHGGLTYSAGLPYAAKGSLNTARQRWWLGFDTAHSWDLVPGLLKFDSALRSSSLFPSTTYRTLAWTRKETERLAQQISTPAKREEAAS